MDAPLTVARDPTATAAIANADRACRPLMVSIEERCGERLLAAFLRCVNARFTGK